MCILRDRNPLWLNVPPTISPQAGILKAGAAGVELPLKAKHALAQVTTGAAAAQRFTFLDSLTTRRSCTLLCSDGARTWTFERDVIGCACDCECRTVQRV